MQSTSEAGGDGAVASLEAAAADLEDAEDAVAAVGEAEAERVADAVDEATSLLVNHRDSATGTGDFRAYIEFQEAVATFVEGLGDDLPRRDAFDDYESAVDDRRLSDSDFEAAREALAPAEAVADRLETRKEALQAYRDARRDVRKRLGTVEDRLAELRRVAELGDADLEAPVEELREPIETYDEAVTDAFEAFEQEAPAREVVDLVAAASERALVDFTPPAEELRAYVESAPVGEEPVTQLLEYADYSRSKLSHYVENADELKRVVSTRQTYLSRLSADPLTVDWPPPEASGLRWRASAYESIVRQFADEAVVVRCREVRRLTRRDDFEDLRRAAVARAELTDEQHRMLADDTLEDRLAELETERERLTAALEEYPER